MITEMEWHPQHSLQSSDWYGEYLCVYVKHSMSKRVGAQNYLENVHQTVQGNRFWGVEFWAALIFFFVLFHIIQFLLRSKYSFFPKAYS